MCGQVCMYHDAGKDMRALIRAFEWYLDGKAPSAGSGRVKFQAQFKPIPFFFFKCVIELVFLKNK